MNLIAAFVIALALVASAFLVCGRYTAIEGHDIALAVIVDRFTGEAQLCTVSYCRPIRYRDDTD